MRKYATLALLFVVFCSFAYPGQRVMVKLAQGADPSQLSHFTKHVQKKLFKVRKQKKEALDRWYVIELGDDSTEVITNLFQNGVIEKVTVDKAVHTQITPNDTLYSNLWGMAKIAAPAAWDTTTGDTSVVLGIVDTGIDWLHEDLSLNIWTNPKEIPGNGIDDDGNGYIDDMHGWNFVANTPNMMDDHSHGTHVSGTVGAVGNNSKGVVGVNWKIKLMGGKGLDASGSGYQSTLLSAIAYCIDNGASVVSNSWGGPGSVGDPVYTDIADYAQANNVLLVFAAGNNNADALSFSPANIDGMLTVAATDLGDVKATFSNWGERIDVAAPGVAITSTLPNNTYGTYSGTSMATPHVAGVAALVKSKFPNLTAGELLQVIRTSADDLGVPGKDDSYGYGRLNAYKALQVARAGVLVPRITNLVSGSKVTGIDTITGTISGANLSSWRVEFGKNGSWTSFGTGTSSKVNVIFNSVSLMEGLTNFRLVAVDKFNREFVDERYKIEIDNLELSIDLPVGLASKALLDVYGKVAPKNGLQLFSYTLQYSQDGITWTQIGSGVPPVFGKLGTWDTRGLLHGQTYTLKLSVNTGSFVASNIRIDSNLVPSYPFIVHQTTDYEWTNVIFKAHAPIFTDVNGDGVEDVVMAGANEIYLNGKLIATGLRIDGITVADLDGDKKKEIIYSAFLDTNRWAGFPVDLRVVNYDGTPKASWPIQHNVFGGGIPVYDFNKDGYPEVLFRNGNGQLIAMDVFGRVATGFPSDYVYFSDDMAVWNGYIAAVSNGTKVALYKGPVKQWEFALDSINGGVPYAWTPAFVEVTGDSIPELAVVSNVSSCAGCMAKFYLLRLNGTLMYSEMLDNYASGNRVWPPATFKQGNKEETILCVWGHIRRYNASGYLGEVTTLYPGWAAGTPIPFILKDGTPLTLVQQGPAVFTALNYSTGATFLNWATGVTRMLERTTVGSSAFGITTSPQVTAFSNGTILEQRNVYAYAWKLPPVAQTWPMYKNNIRYSSRPDSSGTVIPVPPDTGTPPPPLVLPGTPVLLSPANNEIVKFKGGNVTFTWQPSSNTTKYVFEYSSNSFVTYLTKEVTSTTTTAKLDTGTYQWRVKGWNSNGYGPYSKVFTFVLKKGGV